MAVVFCCPDCGREHRSRILALRRRYFDEVVPELGQIVEICPETGRLIRLDYADMRWLDLPKAGVGWI